MNATRLAVVCAGGLAIVGAWMLWHPGGSARGIAAYAPTTATAPTIAQKEADSAAPPGANIATRSSEAQAAKAAYEASRDCYFAKSQIDAAMSVINACQAMPQVALTESQRATCSRNIEQSRATIHELSAAAGTCPKGMASARSFYEATKAAAAQGDADAQACYVQSFFQSNGAHLTYHEQDIDDYRRAAPQYIANGLSHGDWRMVALLARGGHDESTGLLPLITRDDLYTQYVMNRLLQLGADGAYARQLSASIEASYLMPRTTQGPALTHEQIARGNKDALDLFHRSFDHQGLLKGPPSICIRD